MLGNDIDTGEVIITVDDILVAHTGISDLDEMLSHFDVRSGFSTELGRSLARVFDKNVFRQIIKTARETVDGPFPEGETIADAGLEAISAGVYDGNAWIDAIRLANRRLFGKDVPDELERYLAVDADVFDAIKYAVDSNGNYLVLNRDFGNQPGGDVASRATEIEIDGVTVIRSRNIPNTNETSDNSVYSKYRADYSDVLGVMWCPQAIGTVKIMDIGMESARDTRRLEDFMVAKALVGHGSLRHECAVEFTAAP